MGMGEVESSKFKVKREMQNGNYLAAGADGAAGAEAVSSFLFVPP